MTPACGRKLDVAATKAARRQHLAGDGRLARLFGATPLRIIAAGGDQHTGRPFPVRLRKGCPPIRPDAAYRARRRKRKAAHESRRRNRP